MRRSLMRGRSFPRYKEIPDHQRVHSRTVEGAHRIGAPGVFNIACGN